MKLFSMDSTPNQPKPQTPANPPKADTPAEVGGSSKPEPTRYGDWEIGGKCVDF